MNRSKTSFALLGIFLIAFLAMGCNDEAEVTGPGPDPDPDPDPTLVEQGWDDFTSGDYNSAASLFIQAISEDDSDEEAHNGLGWALLNLGNLQNAIVSFDAAIAHGFDGADPRVGRMVILRDQRPVDYAATIVEALAALAIDQNYVFAYDAELDWRDIRLILAHSYFATSDYGAANTQVGLLGGTVQNPASITYVADLLVEIQRLGESIGG
jgi:tetratricopeptide (TPR) repeat protein